MKQVGEKPARLTEGDRRAKPLVNQRAGSLFDDLHAAFVEDAISNSVLSVSDGETNTHRTVTLAGFHQIRADKKTNELTFHTLRSDGAWRKSPTCSFKLFQRWDGMLIAAWMGRMRSRIPKKLPEGRQWEYPQGMSLEVFLSGACEEAARRRLPTRLRNMHRAILARSIWKRLLDAKVLKLTFALHGVRATSEDYNLVASSHAEIAQRVAEAPNLAPLIGVYLKTVTSRAEAGRSDILVHVRQFLFDSGRVNQQGYGPAWRYLAKSSSGLVNAVAGHYRTVIRQRLWWGGGATAKSKYWEEDCADARTAAVILLNALGRCQLDVSVLLVRWLLRKFQVGHASDPLTADRVVRLIAAQSLVERRKGTLKAFLETDMPLVWDYLCRPEAGPHVYGRRLTFQPVPKNATWASVMRAQQEWHATQRQLREEAEARMRAADAARSLVWAAEQKKLRSIVWDPVLKACEVDGFSVTPLVSGHELLDEGKKMDHCVDDGLFMEACQKGLGRVFHLERGAVQSTLLLTRQWASSDKWLIDQHYGFQNQLVLADLALVGKKVLALFKAEFKVRAKSGDQLSK